MASSRTRQSAFLPSWKKSASRGQFLGVGAVCAAWRNYLQHRAILISVACLLARSPPLRFSRLRQNSPSNKQASAICQSSASTLPSGTSKHISKRKIADRKNPACRRPQSQHHLGTRRHAPSPPLAKAVAARTAATPHTLKTQVINCANHALVILYELQIGCVSFAHCHPHGPHHNRERR